jgi:circadian clock protein KaiB
MRTTRAQHYVLCLFVTGMTPRSTQAVAVIKELCDERLAGRYELEIVDLYQDPEQARLGQVIAAPTLVRREPLPERRLIGSLADRERVLAGLGLTTTTLN